MLGIAAGHGGGAPVSVIALQTPLGEEVLSLRAGDRVTLSGIVYTARDEAHMMMEERGIPFDPKRCSDLPLRPDNIGWKGRRRRADYLGTYE